MTDLVNGKGPRDVLVGIIGKAISTGSKISSSSRNRDNAFYAGRVSAFLHSAAMLAELMYGCDFLEVRHKLTGEVEDLHLNADEGNLRDAAYVGNAASEIALRILEEV